MRKELTVALLALAMVLSMGSVAAQEENSDVTVNVSQVTQLDVRPSNLVYGQSGDNGLEPGDSRVVSDGGYEHIEIANIGSEEIEEVSAEATMPSNQTFGATGLDTGEQFNTGNFVTVSTATADNAEYNLSTGSLANLPNMHYLNRVEYVEETPPTYIQTEPENDDVDTGSTFSTVEPEVGRLRVGGAEYFYVFYAATEDASSPSETWALRIGETPHTSTELGTVDFTNSGTDYTEYTDQSTETNTVSGASSAASRIDGHELVTFNTSDSSFTGQSLIDDGAENTTATGIVDEATARSYNLYLNFAEDEVTEHHIARTAVNINLDNPVDDVDYGEVTGSGAQVPIFATQTDGNRLQPGQSFPLDIGVQLPQGVAEDRINTGTVTVLASSTL